MEKKANRLINESSPYLQQHAYNPVDWYSWGEEAFERARIENKPVLVSIGYSSCHWCHVMEKECFEKEEVAEVMNQFYINIKVDREERPDVDQIYMEALQTMNLRGGWPLNVFLTPDAKPFYGGTYFPKSNWLHLLKEVSRAYRENRIELENSADEFVKSINQSEVIKYNLKDVDTTFASDELEKAYSSLERHFDTRYGGLNKTPKFPMPVIWSFLLKYFHTTGNENALRQILLTLDRMSMGGLYDQIGGGFARYSVDGEWFAPHFEKMLYDNGQLLSLYSEAYTLTGKEEYKNIIIETIAWLKREMTHPIGGFYSAQDADTEGEEGKYYIWTSDEIKDLTGEDYLLFSDYFNIKEEGNWEHGYNILFSDLPDAAFCKKHALDKNEFINKKSSWKKVFLKHRLEREKPGIDDKIIASWNGIMLKGLVDAYKSLNDKQVLQLAINNAEFIANHLMSGNILLHTWKDGKASKQYFLEDYAFVAEGFIALYQVSFDEKWLYKAQDMIEYSLTHFLDTGEDMFYFTSMQSEKLIARKKEIFDNVIPSSNSVMAHNLFWLGKLLGKKDYSDLSSKMLGRIKKAMAVDISYLANWASLLTFHINPTVEIAITGPEYLNFREEIERNYFPNKVMAGAEKSGSIALLENREATDNQTTIFVCYDHACQKPVHSVTEAWNLIESEYNANK